MNSTLFFGDLITIVTTMDLMNDQVIGFAYENGSKYLLIGANNWLIDCNANCLFQIRGSGNTRSFVDYDVRSTYHQRCPIRRLLLATAYLPFFFDQYRYLNTHISPTILFSIDLKIIYHK